MDAAQASSYHVFDVTKDAETPPVKDDWVKIGRRARCDDNDREALPPHPWEHAFALGFCKGPYSMRLCSVEPHKLGRLPNKHR